MTKWNLSLILIIILVIIAVYANSLQGHFVYDDEFLIQRNVIVQNAWKNPELLGVAFKSSSTHGSGGSDSFYRPLQITAYSLIYGLFGESPFYFHLFNILLHALNAVFVFLLLHGIFRHSKGQAPPLWAFLATLLWAVHPIHTEAVSYISATADPLHFTFGLIFIFLGMRSAFYWKVLSLVFLMLAFASKEASVTFPGLLFASLFVKNTLHENEKPFMGALRECILPLSFALIYTGLRGSLLDFDNSFQFYSEENIYTSSWAYQLFTGIAALSLYAQLWFWPDHLQIDRSFPVFTSFFETPVLIGCALLVFSLIPVWIYGKGRLRQLQGFGRLLLISPVFCFFTIWFWAYHSLHSGVIVPLNSLFLEHWMYVPSVAFAGALVFSLWLVVLKWKKLYPLALLLLGLALSALAARTWQQNKVWDGPISLYTHILKRSPDIARVHNNLAMAYSDKGDLRLAERHYKESIRISDIYPQVRHNLGLLYLKQSQIDKGIEELKHALEINPGFFQSAAYLAEAYRIKGDQEMSKKYLEIYQKHAPQF